jgi:murein DD-endopeptidase MepM/ murein hydrolase activator NlpD
MSARGWLAALGLFCAAALAGLLWVRAEGEEPRVGAPEALAVGVAGRDVEIAVSDARSGPRSLEVSLVHARGETALAAEQFPGSLLRGASGERERRVALHLDPKAAGAPEGDAFLHVVARDWSWRGGLRGNEVRLEIPVRVDLSPPRIGVRSGLTYVERGGAAVVAYQLDEPAEFDGVAVGDALFRGHPAPAGDGRVAIFAVPTDAAAEAQIRVVARDAAGNLAEASWAAVLQERELPRATVELPKSFLDGPARRLASAHGIPTDDLEQAFARVNVEMRQANEARIRELTADSTSERIWQGAFEQLPNSQVTSRFAERRSYNIDGKPLSEATHFGYDLAATAATPVTAGNAGSVRYAGDLGIYGNCVVLDHGLGLASLYGHLSRIDVAAGDRVAKGQSLGLSGATGLAGGDHLHFAILVGGTYVDPLEWWDAEWVQTHVEAQLGTSGP